MILNRVRSSAGSLLLLLSLALCAAPARALQASGARPTVAQSTTPEAVSPEANEGEQSEEDKYRKSSVVKALGHALGISTDQAATLSEIINFGLLAIGVGFLLLKTLPKTFRDRSGAIQKQLVDARAATEEASVRLNSVEERLTKLDVQIAGMRAQAEQDALADEVRIKASIEEERKRILATAEQEIASASQFAQRRLQQYAAELAIEQAARKLVVTAETDRLIVQGFARRLGVEGPKGGEN